jgi:hypothetical protein
MESTIRGLDGTRFDLDAFGMSRTYIRAEEDRDHDGPARERTRSPRLSESPSESRYVPVDSPMGTLRVPLHRPHRFGGVL